MTDVLRRLDLLPRLRGNGPQRRGPCPVHQKPTDAGRTFSVNLVKQVFRCLDPECEAHGNALDLWAAVRHLPLHAAALDLAKTFGSGHFAEMTRCLELRGAEVIFFRECYPFNPD